MGEMHVHGYHPRESERLAERWSSSCTVVLAAQPGPRSSRPAVASAPRRLRASVVARRVTDTRQALPNGPQTQRVSLAMCGYGRVIQPHSREVDAD